MTDELDEEELKIVSGIKEDPKITAKELAKKFRYSEGGVRSKLTKIYSKLGITGEDRFKRQQLIERLGVSFELPQNFQEVRKASPMMRCGVIIYFMPMVIGILFAVGRTYNNYVVFKMHRNLGDTLNWVFADPYIELPPWQEFWVNFWYRYILRDYPEADIAILVAVLLFYALTIILIMRWIIKAAE